MNFFLPLFLVSTLISLGWACGCCVFNGESYNVGESLHGRVCFVLTCRYDGNGFYWEFERLHSTCSMCKVGIGHTIQTFDRYEDPYYWTGTCNYTLTQYWDPSAPVANSYDSAYGVHSDFTSCSGAGGSCFHKTTIKNTRYVSVELNHQDLSQITVNGKDYVPRSGFTTVAIDGVYYPIISRKWNNCILLIGRVETVLVCPNVVYVWALSWIGTRNGLCGYYDRASGDNDQTLREGPEASVWHTFPVAFPVSWMTNTQSECQAISSITQPAGTNQLTCVNESTYRTQCEEVLAFVPSSYADRQNLIENCVVQLCQNPQNVNFWLSNAAETAQIELMVQILIP